MNLLCKFRGRRYFKVRMITKGRAGKGERGAEPNVHHTTASRNINQHINGLLGSQILSRISNHYFIDKISTYDEPPRILDGNLAGFSTSQDDLGKTQVSLGLAASRLVSSWARQAETSARSY
jgi:hypothetical protein